MSSPSVKAQSIEIVEDNSSRITSRLRPVLIVASIILLIMAISPNNSTLGGFSVVVFFVGLAVRLEKKLWAVRGDSQKQICPRCKSDDVSFQLVARDETRGDFLQGRVKQNRLSNLKGLLVMLL